MIGPTRKELMDAVKSEMEASTDAALQGASKSFGFSFDTVAELERAAEKFPAALIVYAGGKGERDGMPGNVDAARRIEIFVCAKTLAKNKSHQEAALAMLDAAQSLFSENDLGLNMSAVEFTEDWPELITEKYAVYGIAFENREV